MLRKGWYLVAYDITKDKKRSKIFKMLIREGINVQKSTFFIYATHHKMEKLLDSLASHIDKKNDKLSAYPINSAEGIRTNRINPLSETKLLLIN